MYITLYRKYRPKDFSEVYGEEGIIRAIKNGLRENKMPHAYLFCGPRGVGKTTTARLIAKGLNCITNGITDNPCNKCDVCREIDAGTFFDLIEIDAASNRGIDEIRDLKDKINYQPVKGRKKVYIIDEVHMLTKEAFNALLKTLEEPPAHVLFILATTEPDKILDTIISRCQRYDFSAMTVEDMSARISQIADKEGITIDNESMKLIYEKSGGSMRDAVSVFEKVVSYSMGKPVTKEETQAALGLTPERVFEEFSVLIQNGEMKGLIAYLDEIYYSGTKIDDFFKNYSQYLKDSLINGTNVMTADKIISIIETVYETLNRFRHEENKKLVGFVIINKISTKRHSAVNIPNETESFIPLQAKEAAPSAKSISKPVIQEKQDGGITIEVVKGKWNLIIDKVKEAKISVAAFLSFAQPIKLEANVLYMGLKYEHLFHKISLEKKENREILVEVLEEIFGRRIDIKCELVGDKNKRESSDGVSDITKKVIDFFGGDIIDMK